MSVGPQDELMRLRWENEALKIALQQKNAYIFILENGMKQMGARVQSLEGELAYVKSEACAQINRLDSQLHGLMAQMAAFQNQLQAPPLAPPPPVQSDGDAMEIDSVGVSVVPNVVTAPTQNSLQVGTHVPAQPNHSVQMNIPRVNAPASTGHASGAAPSVSNAVQVPPKTNGSSSNGQTNAPGLTARNGNNHMRLGRKLKARRGNGRN